ncbi:hypothetical protein OF83DRAFT_582913 [Amylostereum chailletii]|nr:hypothetical protein OF83DRAFT_582913 [Amylostereum chailletii]
MTPHKRPQNASPTWSRFDNSPCAALHSRPSVVLCPTASSSRHRNATLSLSRHTTSSCPMSRLAKSQLSPAKSDAPTPVLSSSAQYDRRTPTNEQDSSDRVGTSPSSASIARKIMEKTTEKLGRSKTFSGKTSPSPPASPRRILPRSRKGKERQSLSDAEATDDGSTAPHSPPPLTSSLRHDIGDESPFIRPPSPLQRPVRPNVLRGEGSVRRYSFTSATSTDVA